MKPGGGLIQHLSSQFVLADIKIWTLKQSTQELNVNADWNELSCYRICKLRGFV